MAEGVEVSDRAIIQAALERPEVMAAIERSIEEALMRGEPWAVCFMANVMRDLDACATEGPDGIVYDLDLLTPKVVGFKGRGDR
jgi:hypothetical protein